MPIISNCIKNFVLQQSSSSYKKHLLAIIENEPIPKINGGINEDYRLKIIENISSLSGVDMLLVKYILSLDKNNETTPEDIGGGKL